MRGGGERRRGEVRRVGSSECGRVGRAGRKGVGVGVGGKKRGEEEERRKGRFE